MITYEMIQELNTALSQMGVGFMYDFVESDLGPYAKVKVRDNNQGWINSSIVNLTSDYFSWLDNWFWTNYKVKLSYNNNRSSFWVD